ncbi:MAG: NAD(P)H-dependent oxidoreductase subunit E [Spirochaetales bacterium]|jgi:NADH:ubiquinone oxidoreductase subunit E|nr:NAD(P)H-dependent oxidoreductase subunit E [Spirochaetales bacterium]
MDMEKLPELIEKYRVENGTVIGLLQDIHDEYTYLPEEVLESVSKEIEVPLSTLYSLATFYSTFRLEPMGKHHICTCVGTACHVKGAPFVVDSIERELNIKAGETTEDGNFTFDTVNCLGACALAPLVIVDEDYHGKMDQKKASTLVLNFKKEIE